MSHIHPGVTGKRGPSSVPAGVNPDELLPSDEAAALLRQKPATLAAWRSEKKGPAWAKIGRQCFYLRADLEAWIAAQRRDPQAA